MPNVGVLFFRGSRPNHLAMSERFLFVRSSFQIHAETQRGVCGPRGARTHKTMKVHEHSPLLRTYADVLGIAAVSMVLMATVTAFVTRKRKENSEVWGG